MKKYRIKLLFVVTGYNVIKKSAKLHMVAFLLIEVTDAELGKKQSEQNSMSQSALEIIPDTQHILDNYDVLNPEQKNELWKLVLRKVTMFRGETNGPLRIKLYPNLPQ